MKLYILLAGIGIVFLLVSFLFHDMKQSKRMRKLVPLLMTPEWIEAGKLRRQLESRGLIVSYGLFYLIMKDLVKEGLIEYKDEEDEDGRTRFFRLPH